MISFTNEKTAAAYEALTGIDQWLEVPLGPKSKREGCGSCKAYKGMLSAITPCAAERYIKFKGNLIAKKTEQVQEEENIN